MFKHSMPRKVLIVLGIILLVRFVFLMSIGFVDDDAYHWSWTQMPMLSYYDHPGMIAWLEWITTRIFGDTKLGIRLPSFLCFAVMLYLLWGIARDLFNDKAAKLILVIFILSPLWGIGGYASAPESPFMVLWLLAFWVFYQGLREDDARWSLKKTWLWLGLIMGIAVNTKFPIAMLAFGFGLFLMVDSKHRESLLSKWPWVGLVVATVMAIPVFWWNIQYDWPGFKYQFHERHADGGFDPKRWLVFLSTQIAVLSPGLFAFVGATCFLALQKRKTLIARYIGCVFLVSFLVFYFQPFFADYKPHWMGPVYLLMILLGVGLWSETALKKWMYVILAFLIPLNLIVYTAIVHPILPKIHRQVSEQPWKPEYDFTNEFYGWNELGEFVQQLLVTYQGEKPFLASHRYETTAQTYLATKQRVWMLNTTKSHYTVTQTASEIEALKGRNALFVVTNKYFVDPLNYALFDSCEPHELRTYRGTELARIFTVFYCRNFQAIK
jgi:4-amino-4-deoxy-L-arabinose transferase-like glycosyltransferase